MEFFLISFLYIIIIQEQQGNKISKIADLFIYLFIYFVFVVTQKARKQYRSCKHFIFVTSMLKITFSLFILLFSDSNHFQVKKQTKQRLEEKLVFEVNLHFNIIHLHLIFKQQTKFKNSKKLGQYYQACDVTELVTFSCLYQVD